MSTTISYMTFREPITIEGLLRFFLCDTDMIVQGYYAGNYVYAAF